MERLEGYTDDELDQIADDNENWDPAGQGDTPADATEGMRLFIDGFPRVHDRARRGADRYVGADRFDGGDRQLGADRLDRADRLDGTSRRRPPQRPTRPPPDRDWRGPRADNRGRIGRPERVGRSAGRPVRWVAAAFFFGGGTPTSGAGSASAGQRRRDTIDNVRSSFIATSSSCAGLATIVPSAIIRLTTSSPSSVRTMVNVQSLSLPMPPRATSACSAAKSGHRLQPSRVQA